MKSTPCIFYHHLIIKIFFCMFQVLFPETANCASDRKLSKKIFFPSQNGKAHTFLQSPSGCYLQSDLNDKIFHSLLPYQIKTCYGTASIWFSMTTVICDDSMTANLKFQFVEGLYQFVRSRLLQLEMLLNADSMCTVNVVELNSIVKEEPFNYEDKVESTGTLFILFFIKLSNFLILK